MKKIYIIHTNPAQNESNSPILLCHKLKLLKSFPFLYYYFQFFSPNNIFQDQNSLFHHLSHIVHIIKSNKAIVLLSITCIAYLSPLCAQFVTLLAYKRTFVNIFRSLWDDVIREAWMLYNDFILNTKKNF